jgi:CheY-like chemotaxis protein
MRVTTASRAMDTAARPGLSILAAEDDPILGRFLVDALVGAGHRVQLATTGADALDAARRERYDLLIMDLQLPDADGARLLDRLRHDADAASRAVPAIAMSGELPSDRRAALLAVGFAEAWQKPVSLATLESLDVHRLREPLPAEPEVAPSGDAPLLDDATALLRLGSEATVRALRGLLAGELPRQWRTVTEALDAGDVDAALAILHRARAGCALCGANAAAAALGDLESALRAGVDLGAPRDRATTAVERTVARLAGDAPG